MRRFYGFELTAVAGDRIGDGERECSGTASAAPPRLQLLVLRFSPVLCLIKFFARFAPPAMINAPGFYLYSASMPATYVIYALHFIFGQRALHLWCTLSEIR